MNGYAVGATLVGVILPTLGIAAAFLIGWLLRGSVDHRRARELERRRRAVVGARSTVARPGTGRARVSTARINRGKEMQGSPEE